MGKIQVTYERESKLPGWATLAVLQAMRREGKSYREMEKIVGVSRETIRLLLLPKPSMEPVSQPLFEGEDEVDKQP